MKYRLIAGTINRYEDDAEWENVHLDVSNRGIWHPGLHMAVLPEFVASLTDLSFFRQELFDEVRCHHVIEHLSLEDGRVAVREINRVLKIGGTFDVEVPDLDRVCQAYVHGELDSDGARQWLYGEQLKNHEPGDSHRFLYTETELVSLLSEWGDFEVNERKPSGLALRFFARKYRYLPAQTPAE